ncbi:hypothetical protein ATP_00203 [Candidatus Phytoplasma mali]|uniref:Integral membrane protein n=1 Tax=Phytoplasma mali (strain AT) TaxID=482235 RepID=B3QZK3_PHYMT|nr:YitT family protein [Candidatus Phytoplasma mali]CAP18390.1 hypothetical protein ATP_00203 [Candidatus Phytoplasma mali]
MKYFDFINLFIFFKFILGFIFLFFGIYFFILPKDFIIGGLEGSLIFLDKIFFYKNGKQNHFFTKNNVIVIIRIIFLFLSFFFHDLPFFLKTLIITIFFSFCFKLFDYYKINKNFFIYKFPNFIKNNNIYELFLSIIIIILSVGFGCGFIFSIDACTGGTDCIFLKLNLKYNIELFYILFFTDGLIIIISFLIDLYRKINNKKIIFVKYICSYICFFTVSFIINILNKYIK